MSRQPSRSGPARQDPPGDGDAAWNPYPGANLGLPQTDHGSLASWVARGTALVLDWALSMAVARLVFGPAVLVGHDARSFLVPAAYVVLTAIVSALTGATVGQRLCRIGIARLDGAHLGLLRAAVRALMVSLVIPALVIDENRRGLHDLVCGTAVLAKR